MNPTYLVFLVLCLVALATRTGYELLKKAGRVDTKNKLVFAAVFVAMGLMLTSWILLGRFDPRPVALPGAARWFGFAVLIAGFALALGALFRLRGLENIDRLETSGLYSRIRHPMYTGFIFWISGWVIYKGAAVTLVVALIAIGNVLFWRRLEEKRLESRYGEEYRTYRRRTWF